MAANFYNKGIKKLADMISAYDSFHNYLVMETNRKVHDMLYFFVKYN